MVTREVWWVCCIFLFYKKLRSGATEVSKTGVNVNEVLAQELHKRVTEKKKNEWRKKSKKEGKRIQG